MTNQENMKKPRVPEAILIAILLAVSLAMAGCVIEPPANVDCDCPNLERILGTLNWLPGHPNYEVSRPTLPYDEPHKEVRVRVLTNAPDRDLAVVASRIRDAGVPLEGFGVDDPASETRYGVNTDAYSLGLTESEIDGSSAIQILVFFYLTDDEAERIFAPLIDTFGFKNATESG